jgi:hypothetical protein
MPIPGCQLSDEELGPQLRRYRQLAEHVADVQRNTGEVRVLFNASVPVALLAHTLEVERECCSFVALAYDPEARLLTIEVENISEDPRLDSLAALLSREQTTHGS